MRHQSGKRRRQKRFTTKPCLYSGLISRNLNLCYVLSTDNDIVTFPEVIIILWSRRRLSFFWEEIYSKYLELMCHGTYNYVFQCKSVCVCVCVCVCVFEGVSIWGGHLGYFYFLSILKWCYEHLYACIFSNESFHLFRIYAQEWDCLFIW